MAIIYPMRVLFLILLMLGLVGFSGLAESAQNHVILTGGPALRKWENLRVKRDQHDRWWANFVRGATLRMVEIRRAYGADAAITWMVYRPGYVSRGYEDRKPYVTWIKDLAARRKVLTNTVSSSITARKLWVPAKRGCTRTISQKSEAVLFLKTPPARAGAATLARV